MSVVGFETLEESQRDQSVIQLEPPPSTSMADKQPSEMPNHQKAKEKTITVNTTSEGCSFSPSILSTASLRQYSRNPVAQKRAQRSRDAKKKLGFQVN